MEAMVLQFPAERRHDGDAADLDGVVPACAGEDERWWFEPDLFDRGRQLCDGCAIRRHCLTQALLAGERHGLWGGLTPDERAGLPLAAVIPLPSRRRMAGVR